MDKVLVKDYYGRVVAVLPKGRNLDDMNNETWWHEAVYRIHDGRYAYLKWYDNQSAPVTHVIDEYEAFQLLLKHGKLLKAEKYFPDKWEHINDVVEL